MVLKPKTAEFTAAETEHMTGVFLSIAPSMKP
jgi:hypothetical protein